MNFFRRFQEWIPVTRSVTGIFLVLTLLTSGCATDSKQLKASRDAYLAEDYPKAEAALYSKEVFKQTENRFVHYSSLASIAMASGEYEKAIFFLLKSRDLVNNLRSSQAGFDWFSKNYLSNGIEYSYLHYFLVMAHLLLAEEGKTSAWTTPEVKDKDGTILVPLQSFPARVFDARQIADLRTKARAELLAWDSHFNHLKNSNSNPQLYRDDVWARLLASYLHSLSEQNSEKRIGELLARDAIQLLEKDFKKYPSAELNADAIQTLASQLQKGKAQNPLFVLEAGVISKPKIKRFHIGLSTLFKGIKDPYLRAQLESIGFQIILQAAPEFGLVLFTGAMAGAVSGSAPGEDELYDGPPRHFTDAVDESFGFLIQFPSLEMPPADTRIQLLLQGTEKKSSTVSTFQIPVVCPMQEILATELKNREGQDMFEQSIKIGLQYLAVLIPAIKTYQAAVQEGNFIKRLAAIAGYYMAKKMIDNAHQPDIRSWSYLPKLVAANLLDLAPGSYQGKVILENENGKVERTIGEIRVAKGLHPLIRKRIGEVSILKKRQSFETIRP